MLRMVHRPTHSSADAGILPRRRTCHPCSSDSTSSALCSSAAVATASDDDWAQGVKMRRRWSAGKPLFSASVSFTAATYDAGS